MNPRQLFRILSGQNAVAAALLYVLAALCASAPILQRMHTLSGDMAQRVAVAKAAEIADAVVDGSANVRASSKYRIQRVAPNASPSDAFVARAQAALRNDPSQPFVETVEREGRTVV